MVKESPSVREMLQRQRTEQDVQAGAMYGHRKREPVPQRAGVNPNQYDRPIGPVYSKADQYAAPIGPEHPHAKVNPRQYAEPAGPRPQSSLEKVKSYGKRVASEAHGTFIKVGQNPHIQQIASQSGFGGAQSAPSRRPRAPPQERGDYSSGETIYITRCDAAGNCKQTKLRGGGQRQPRRRAPSWAAGTLGGDDPGFW